MSVSAKQLEDSIRRGRTRGESEFRAETVRYRQDEDAIEIVTTDGAGFLIPRVWIDDLADLRPEDMTDLEVWPGGMAFELPRHDVHVSIHGLLVGVLPKMVPRPALASLFARRGGTATSEAKRASARNNGAKGGRPRKVTATA